MTTAQFDFILSSTKQTRENMRTLMSKYSLEQLNTIPAGFNNNLIWNFGHVVVTHQLLCIGLSGLPIPISSSLVDAYRKGSSPNRMVTQQEVDEFLANSDRLLSDFALDYQEGRFQYFREYTTSFGVALSSVEEAFQFNLTHEAMHLGTMIALQKLL